MNPMHTAAVIARIRAAESSLPPEQQLFSDPHAHLFDDPRADVDAVLGAMPFFREQVRLRTRFIDDAIRSALGEGIGNIVLLGAGFDTRALRMPELSRPGVRVVEVDHAEQIADKRAVLGRAGLELPPTLTFAPTDLGIADLAEVLPPALETAGVTRGAPTLWIGEGLVGYLTPSSVELLAGVTFRHSGASSRLVANHVVPMWSAAVLADVFTRSGWAVRPAPSFEELHRRFIGEHVAPGSDLFAFLVAERAPKASG